MGECGVGGGCCCWEMRGVTLGRGGCGGGGGHQCTAAKLMPFFFFLCLGTEEQSVVAH